MHYHTKHIAIMQINCINTNFWWSCAVLISGLSKIQFNLHTRCTSTHYCPLVTPLGVENVQTLCLGKPESADRSNNVLSAQRHNIVNVLRAIWLLSLLIYWASKWMGFVWWCSFKFSPVNNIHNPSCMQDVIFILIPLSAPQQGRFPKCFVWTNILSIKLNAFCMAL